MLNRRDDDGRDETGRRTRGTGREYLVVLGGKIVRRCLTEDRAILTAAEMRLRGDVPRIYRANRLRPWG